MNTNVSIKEANSNIYIYIYIYSKKNTMFKNAFNLKVFYFHGPPAGAG
jgi:hypothetical protein